MVCFWGTWVASSPILFLELSAPVRAPELSNLCPLPCEMLQDQLGTGLGAVNYQHQGSVAVFTPPLSTEDRRSAAILARKEEIELVGSGLSPH